MTILILNAITESALPQLVTDVLINSYFNLNSFSNFKSPFVVPSAAINPLDFKQPHTLLTMTKFNSNDVVLLQQRAPCFSGQNKKNAEFVAESFKSVDCVVILSHLDSQHMKEYHIGRNDACEMWSSDEENFDFLGPEEKLIDLRGQGNTISYIDAFAAKGVPVKVIYFFSKNSRSAKIYAGRVAEAAGLRGEIKVPQAFKMLDYEAPLDENLGMY